MRQGEKFVCLGEEQYLYVAKQEGDEMPQAVEVYDDDGATVKKMKQLILKMTSYSAKDRPSADTIVKATSDLLLQVSTMTTTVGVLTLNHC